MLPGSSLRRYIMNGLAAAWVLTDITDSAGTIAALQIAVAFPTFLLALVTGALADVVNRKKIILFSQIGSVMVAGIFALIEANGSSSVGSVLGLTTVLGILTAIAAPAWIAIIPGLVDRDDLGNAMTLSSAGVSVGMAAGPALGGFIIASSGPQWVFLLNAILLALGVLALRTWEPESQHGLPAEHLWGSVQGGLRYLRHDTALKIVIAKIIPFAFGAVALVSLLPAIARFRLGAGAAEFGLLSAAGGIGAVIGLVVVPRLRRRVGPDASLLAATLVEAGGLAVLASTTSFVASLMVLIVIGVGTLLLISTSMTMLQVVLPAWIRGRGVSVYLLALQGTFAVGAFVWGLVANATSLTGALRGAAVVLVVGGVATWFLHLDRYVDTATESAALQFQPITSGSVHDSDGPILLTARWHIQEGQRNAFVAAMTPIRRALRRNGALSWQLAEDVTEPGVFVEAFTMATWSEYQRLPERTTVDDKHLEEALFAAAGTDIPTVSAHRVLDLD